MTCSDDGTATAQSPTRIAFARTGTLTTGALFDDATMASAAVEVDSIWRDRTAALAQSADHATRAKADFERARPELSRLHLVSPLLSRICRARPLADLARSILGDDVDLVWNQAYVKAPHGDPRTEIPWHQDGWYAEVDGLVYNCWLAITPSHGGNGGLYVADDPHVLVPHEWDDTLLFFRCKQAPASEREVRLAPGQAILFSTTVPHRSSINVSSETRISYAISFGSPETRLVANGEAFGDRVPVMRRGVWIEDLFDRAASGDESDARRVLDELRARAPGHDVDADYTDHLDARRRGDAARADETLFRLLAAVPDSPEVLGDLVRARARVDQLHGELRKAMSRDVTGASALARRILELSPDDAVAAAFLNARDPRPPS